MSQNPRATRGRPRKPAVVTRIAQLARALPLQGRCRGFESLCAHRLPSWRRATPTTWLKLLIFQCFGCETS